MENTGGSASTAALKRLAIVGAGISGLALAFRLKQLRPDFQIVLFEQHDRPGGNIGTEDSDGFRVERGPNGFLDSKPSTIELCKNLGLGNQLLSASEGSRKNRYVFWNGKLRALPGSLWSFATSRLLSIRGKLNLLLEKYRKPHPDLNLDESVHEFVVRRAGREIAEIFADALVTGIHGGDPEKLSMKAAFPRVMQFEREHGSIMRGMNAASRSRRKAAAERGEAYSPPRMWSFKEGLRTLVQALRVHLADSLRTAAKIRRIEKTTERGWLLHGDGLGQESFDAVVLACPAFEQAALLSEIDSQLAEELSAIRYNRIAVVALGFKQSDCPGNLDGFGYIAPQRLKRDVLGIQWCSSIFPDRAPPGFVLWRALCGGAQRGEMVDWDDDRLARAVFEELKISQGVRGEPVFRKIVRWPQAIPQYVVGHLDRVARIEAAAAKHRGLFLAGNSFHGVALNDCTERAEVLARMITAT